MHAAVHAERGAQRTQSLVIICDHLFMHQVLPQLQGAPTRHQRDEHMEVAARAHRSAQTLQGGRPLEHSTQERRLRRRARQVAFVAISTIDFEN